jgi:hypothetical protein
MKKAKLLSQAKQEILGKHARVKEWIGYSGKLTIYDSKTNPVTPKIRSKVFDSFLAEIMDDEKKIRGASVTEVLQSFQNGCTSAK